MRGRRARNPAWLVAAALVGWPTSALACPVCFGALDGPVADGVNMAVLALLGLTLAVLGGFATFFVYLMKRSGLAEAATLEAQGSLLET